MVSYNQWQTRKRAWDTEWKITEGGPSTEARYELDKLPIWFDCNKNGLTQTYRRAEKSKLFISSIPFVSLRVLIGTGLNKPRKPTRHSSLQSPLSPLIDQVGKASTACRKHRCPNVPLGPSESRSDQGCSMIHLHPQVQSISIIRTQRQAKLSLACLLCTQNPPTITLILLNAKMPTSSKRSCLLSNYWDRQTP